MFVNKKFQFGKIFEGLKMKDVAIFYGHLVYFTTIWYILWLFGILYGHLAYLSRLVSCTKKNLATPAGG
jgi:hypothetical protein